MRQLNIPYSFIKHMNADNNYSYDNFILRENKGVFSLYADDDGGKKNTNIARYSVEDNWIYHVTTPLLIETLDLFIELCKRYYELGDNVLKLTEYGIMGE